jgi:hypothetical protein
MVFNATFNNISVVSWRAYFCHQQTLNDLNKNNNWEDLENESFPLHDKGNSRLMAFGHQGVASFRH